MTEYNDPKHNKQNNNIPEDEESYYTDEAETEYAYHQHQPSPKRSQDRKGEAQRLVEEERELANAQRLTIIRKVTQSISYLVVALETLLGLRFILLITGANPENIFAKFIYALSEPFALPFSNLFQTIEIDGATHVFDINLLIGMVVYLLLMLLVNWLIKIIANP